ncbi:annexin D5-like [Rhododendron vialii]|uniref:annexin D5-like n=1 Tax=Rhododendron vialii TaxID=182163 RepID=UPI00265D645F|nr:annexin D5-like [Rhododendron vialii]
MSTAHPEVKAAQAESVPPEITNAWNDATSLHRAFEGKGCDEATIVNILANRSATERALIRKEYNSKFSEDLDIALSKELVTGDLKEAVLLWMREPGDRDAKLVQQALTGEFNIAIEVICSRTPSQIQALKQAYRSMSGVDLDKDIGNHASFDHKKLLLAYVDTTRFEGPEVDAKIVEKDVKELYKDGEERLGTNEATFIRIFTERSSAHLAEINSVYRHLYENSLEKAVKKETSGRFEFALLTILQCAENPGKYFAKALYEALNPLIAITGIDKRKLTRIIVSRAEIDIEQIKAEYKKENKKSLSDDVHSKTSGNYRSFLVSLLEPNH